MRLVPPAPEIALDNLFAAHQAEMTAAGYPTAGLAALQRAVQSGELPTLIALGSDDQPIGLVAWSLSAGRGHIRAWIAPADQHESAVALLAAALRTLRTEGGHTVTFLLHGSRQAEQANACRAAGFQSVQVDRLRLDNPDTLPTLPVPAGFRLLPWRRTHLLSSIALFRSLPRLPMEEALWPSLYSERGQRELFLSLAEPAPADPPPLCYALLAEQGGLAGYILCNLMRDGSGRIGEVAVNPSRQKAGLGRLLVTTGVQALCRHGASPIWLTVRNDNAPAVSLYTSLGFLRHESQFACAWQAEDSQPAS